MYLQRYLKSQIAAGVRQLGDYLYAAGKVRLLSGNQWRVEARVKDEVVEAVTLTRRGAEIGASCSCPDFETEGACRHVWAAIRAADTKSYLLGSVGSGPPALTLTRDEDDGEEVGILEPAWEETEEPKAAGPRRAKRAQAPPRWRTAMAGVVRQPWDRRPEAVWPAGRELYYVVDTAVKTYEPGLVVEINARDRLKTGGMGKAKPVRIGRDQLVKAPEGDREALMVLGGAPAVYGYFDDAAGIPSSYYLRGAGARLLLKKLCATGRCLLRGERGTAFEEWKTLDWDYGERWRFRLEMERRPRSWLVRGNLVRGGERMELEEVEVMARGGVMIAKGRVGEFDDGGAYEWLKFLREQGAFEVPVGQGQEFVGEMLSQEAPPPVEWPEELKFEEIAEKPVPCLRVGESDDYYERRQKMMRAEVFYEYGGVPTPEEPRNAGLYDPVARRLVRRDAEAEREAERQLERLGARRRAITFRAEKRWQVPEKRLKSLVATLAAAGWKLEVRGRSFRQATGFRGELSSGIDWFELHGEVAYGETRAALPALLKALERGEEVVELEDGSFGLMPREVLERYGLLLRMGKSEGGVVKFARTQAGLLDVLLAGRGEVKVDRMFERARARLRAFEGVRAVEQPAGFVGELRGYQKEGLGWMEFLREFAATPTMTGTAITGCRAMITGSTQVLA